MIILATKDIPQHLSSVLSTQNTVNNFIVGYRHRISADGWFLSPDPNFSTRSFCFTIKTNIQQVKKCLKQTEEIEEGGGNYLIIRKKQKLLHGRIEQAEIIKLLGQIDGEGTNGLDEVCYNIMMNNYDNDKQYQESVGWWIEQKIKKQASQTILQKSIQEYNLKGLSGVKVFQVPQFSKETGNWDSGQTLKLKMN